MTAYAAYMSTIAAIGSLGALWVAWCGQYRGVHRRRLGGSR